MVTQARDWLVHPILPWSLPIITWSGVTLNAAFGSHSYCVIPITEISVLSLLFFIIIYFTLLIGVDLYFIKCEVSFWM